MPENIIEYYTKFAEKYEETIHQDKDYIAFIKIPQWIIKELPEKNSHILDLGCGTGLGSRGFFECSHSVTGIDITPKMIEQCAKLPFKNLICQSVEDPLPFEDMQFDAAIMLGVMEFIENPLGVFHEIARLLKPGALFGITVPKRLPPEIEAKLDIITYDLFKIESLFAQAGFLIRYTEEFQGFIYQDEIIQYQGYLLAIH